jgi:hypothetical protein
MNINKFFKRAVLLLFAGISLVVLVFVPLQTKACTVYNITSPNGSSYCAGGSGVQICLDGSDAGVNYRLFLDGSPTSTNVTGTGYPICFGYQTVAGTYTVYANCGAWMNNPVTITIDPLPTQYEIIPSANFQYCVGMGAGNIRIENYDANIYYYLIKNGNYNYNYLFWSLDQYTSNYTCPDEIGKWTAFAVDQTTGCQNDMIGSVVIYQCRKPDIDINPQILGNNNLRIQNYPNPFAGNTAITYFIPENNFVEVSLYSLQGEKEKTIISEFKNAGSYTINFIGDDINPGVYALLIQSGSQKATQMMMIMK